MENNEELRINEIDETEVFDEVEATPRRSGLGTIGAMAIGSGLTLGGIALFKKLKKVMAEKRAKMEAKDAENDETEDFDEVESKPQADTEPKVKDQK